MKIFKYSFIISALISLCFSFIYSQQPTPVYVASVAKKIVTPTIDLSGTVEYPELSNVSTEISGIVQKIYFDEGDIVKKGTVLLKLNSDILEKEILITKANYAHAQEELKLKKWEYERYDTLYSSGDIPLRDLRKRETEYLKSSFNVEKYKAELEKLELTLEKKSIKAPFNGVVVKKLTYTGNWIEAGMAAAIIAANDMIDIICHAPQNISQNLTKGDNVEVICNKKVINAKVSSVIPYGDVNTRTFPIRIRAKNQENLASGMEVKVKVQTSKPRQSFIIPRDAIIIRNDNYSVFVVDNSKAKEIFIDIINYEGKNAEVQSEMLKDKMKIVIRGNQFLKDGQMLEIIK